jgi:hypothetical protein
LPWHILTLFSFAVAFVTNIYETVYQRAYTEWTVIQANVIVSFELAFSLPANNSFLKYIIPHLDRNNK